jgi:hypothetical protein
MDGEPQAVAGDSITKDHPMNYRTICSLCQVGLLAAVALACHGCTVLGAIAGKTSTTMIMPAYTGFAGQSVGVMVVTDPGTRTDFPRIQLDVSENLYNKMKGSQAMKAEELLNTRFPREAAPDAIYAFQRNYPQMEWEPIANVAPKFNVTRLVYVEVDSLTLHPNNVAELYRGNISGRVQVIEVTNGVAKSAYSNRVSATFPEDPNSPGVLNANSREIYNRTLDVFSARILEYFIAHEAPANQQ